MSPLCSPGQPRALPSTQLKRRPCKTVKTIYGHIREVSLKVNRFSKAAVNQPTPT